MTGYKKQYPEKSEMQTAEVFQHQSMSPPSGGSVYATAVVAPGSPGFIPDADPYSTEPYIASPVMLHSNPSYTGSSISNPSYASNPSYVSNPSFSSNPSHTPNTNNRLNNNNSWNGV